MPQAKVGRRGQLTLPKEIRAALKLNEGDYVAFVEKDGEFILRPMRGTLRDLRGSVPVSTPQDFRALRGQASTVPSSTET